jgi:putative nucleotidyltransferase with HDIG domain
VAYTTLRLDHVIDKIKEIPTLPDVVFKVSEVVNNPNTSAADLEDVIAHDQAIAAKVLKLVNSAFYGLPGKVDTLSRAIPLLGFSTVRNLVMSVSIFNISAISEFDMKAFWRHSFATSTAARAIAIADGLPDAETHSLAGLLHDMGKVVMFQYFVKEYLKVIDLMEKKNLTFLQAERELYQVDHTEVGRELTSRWGFPPNLVAAIAHHHNPENAGDLCDFVSVTATANAICMIVDEERLIADLGFEVAAEASEGFHPLNQASYAAVMKDFQRQMPFFKAFVDRMENIRHATPLPSELRRNNKGSVWTVPEKQT